MRLILKLSMAIAVVFPCWGTVILTAYPQSSSGAFSLNGTPVINVAGGFTMGATAFGLTSAEVQFQANGVAQFSTSVVAADLYGGTGGPTGVPSGAPLDSFVIPAGTIAGTTDITMTPASAFTLQAATSYWLVLHVNSSVGGNLGVSSALNPATGSFATYVGMTQDGSLPPQTRQSANLLFEIDGTAAEPPTGAPEPGTTALLALGAAMLVVRLLRRARC